MIQPIQSDSRAYITRILAVIIATGVIVGVIFGIYSLFGNDDNSVDMASQERIVSVEIGDVVDTTQIRGITSFQDSSFLSFGVQGVISKVHVSEGEMVRKGTTLVELDDHSLAAAELTIATAEYRVHNIRQQLETVILAEAQELHTILSSDWTSAEAMANTLLKKKELVASLRNAELALDALLNPSEVALASAELEYLSLQLSLKAIQQDYDEMLATVSFPNINELDHTRARLSVLRHQRDEALATWERMVAITKSQYSEEELLELFGSSFHEVEMATHALSEIDAQVAALMSSHDEELLALKQAELSEAQTALKKAKAAVIRITAPHDGVVRNIHMTENAHAAAHQVVIELADNSGIQLRGFVPEHKAVAIDLNAKCLITLDALPHHQVGGEIVHISRTPVIEGNEVFYPVSITLEQGESVANTLLNQAYILEGLSATVDIIVAESRNILRIPLHTVTGSLVLPTVTLLDDGSEIPEHPITTGNSDDYWIEIIDGLSEGDQVIGTYLESSRAIENENLKVVAN